MKKSRLFAILAGMAVLSFSLFNSCEIGLGESVDTEAPSLSINNPPTSAVVRDAFAISGNWSDDGSIDGISISLKNTETKQTFSFSGSKGNGTWSCLIDPTKAGSEIKDGKYEATVTISDNGGHKTSSSRAFVIDNTPPVVVLQRPASSKAETDSNKIESYGQYLTIEGQAADDNDIEKLVIKFYSKEAPDTLICQKEITSVPPTISLDVAKFLDKDVYSKIYGDEKDKGEKSYYCEIIAYDGAKRYPAEGYEKADDAEGNSEPSYILWSAWEKFQTEYQKATNSSSKIKIPDLYSLKAGKTTTTASRSAAAESLVTNLFATAISSGSFKLNPLNNPTFSISGLELDVANDVENERSLTVQLSKGLDGLSLDTENMKVYLIPITTDANGNEVRGKKIYPQKSDYQQKGDGQFLTTIQKDNCKDENGNAVSLEYGKSYVIAVEGTDSENNKIVPSFDGKEFFIRFKAKNVAPGLTIESPAPTTSYLKKGDKLLIKGTTSVPDGYPTISVVCKKGDATTGQTIYSHKVTEADKEKIEAGLIIYNFEYEVPVDGSNFKFDQANSDQYVFDITSDMDNMPTTRTKTVIYDIDGPTISIDSMLPTAEKYKGTEDGATESGEYLNGNVTMKIAIIDDYDTVNTEIKDPANDKRPYFIIEDAVTGQQISFRVGTETVPTVKHYITTPAKQSFVIHTEDIASGTLSRKIKVKIFAEDRAGNLGVDIEDTNKKYFVREFTVDQSTDIPVILPSNYNSLSLLFDTKEKLEAQMQDASITVKKSVLTAGSPLQLKLIDDDGIASSVFKISEKDTGNNLQIPQGYNQTYSNTPSQTVLEYTLPIVSGKYKCYVSITDTVGNTKDKTFWIVSTGAAPVVTVSKTTPDNKTITLATTDIVTGAKNSIKNEISIDSGYNAFTVTRQEDGCEPVVLYGTNGIKGTILNGLTFEDIFTPSASRTSNKVVYTVTDENSHDGTREFTYYIDSTKPVVLDTTQYPIGVPSTKQTESASFRFTATAQDNAAANETSSGISKLQYTFDAAKSHIVDVTGVSSLSETIVFNDNSLSYVFGTEGKKKIYIRAIDDVGNIGNWVEKEFMYDTANPELKVESYKRGTEAEVEFAENSASMSFETGEAFVLKGRATDGTGIEKFEIWQKKNGTTYTNGTNTDSELGLKLTDISISSINNAGEWTVTGLPRNESNITQTNVDSGKFIYTIRAIDKSAYGTDEAKKTDKKVTVNIDKTKPVVSITLPALTDNGIDSTAYGDGSLSGVLYTFRGKATDDPANPGDFSSGFDTLYYTFTKTDSAPAKPYASSIKPSTESWSIPMNLGTGATNTTTHKDTEDTLYEGKKYLWIYGVDNAGNISATKKVAFMVDQSAPENEPAVYKDNDLTTPIPADSGIVYLNKATGATKYTLKGTVSDENGISIVKVDGTPVSVTDGSWSKEFNVQGKKDHKVEVFDASGNDTTDGRSTTKTVSVIFDTSDPEITIADLDSTTTAKTSWVSANGATTKISTYINGTASDTGSDLKTLTIKVDGVEATIPRTSSNWSYKYEISNPTTFTENTDSDSSYHTVEVVAEDYAKNTTTKTAYFRYDKEAPKASLTLNKNGKYIKTSDLTDVIISGYAHDGRTTGRAVKEAKIVVTRDGTEISANEMNVMTSDYGYVSTAGPTFGNFSKTGLDPTKYTDGEYEFTLNVLDKAGNTPKAGSPTAKMTVDTTPPEIVTNSLTLTDWNDAHSRAQINVEFVDKNPDTVYYYVNDYSKAGITQPSDVTNINDWTVMTLEETATPDNYKAYKVNSFSDGNGTVYIKIVDKAGNVTYGSNSALNYEVDTKAPELCTLGTVKVNNTELSGSSKLINGNNDVVFTVTAKDNNENRASPGAAIKGDDATRIASVKLTKIGGTAYADNAIVDGEATLSNGTTGTKTGEWTITIPKAKFNGINEGSLPVTVTVADTNGNSKSFQLFTLDIDKVKPEIKNYALDSSYNKGLVNGKQTFYMNNINNSFKLTGIASDNREVATVTLTLTGTKNGSAYTKTMTSDNPSWTFEIDKDSVTDAWKNWSGTVNASLSVVDKAANVVEAPSTFDIIFDTAVPNASITTSSWTDGIWISGTGKVYINGNADDISSVKNITMKLDSGTATPVPVADPWTYELNCAGIAENDNTTSSKHTLTLEVTDGCGNVKTLTQDFKLDKTTPVIKDLSVKNAATGAYTKSITDVKASGYAYDGVQNNYRPVTLTITAANSNGTAVDIGGTNKVITVTTGSTNNTTFGSFSDVPVSTKTLADGEYLFTVKATDYAGNEAQEQVTITVDNTPPVVNSQSLGSWNTTGSAATITANFTEVNPDSAYYYIDDRSTPSRTQENVPEADWVSMNINGTTATKSCTFSDGKGKVYIKVVDKAGNVGYATALDYEVDTKAPDVCTLGTVDGVTLSGSKLINGNNDVVFTVNATDYNDNRNLSGAVIGADPTRVSSVNLTKIGTTTYTGSNIVNGTATLTGGTTGTKTGEWTITIPASKFEGKTTGSFPVTVTVTDTTVNGKTRSKDYQLFTLDIDQVKPTLNSYALSSSYDAGLVGPEGSKVQTFYMNNTRDPFTLTGVAKDDREIETVTLTLTGTKNGSAYTKTMTSSDSAWTFEIPKDTGDDAWKKWSGTVNASLSVKDKAQNEVASPKTFKIIFDTTAPAALHKTDTSGKDIYFRVGDQDRDDGITSINNEGDITATPAWDAALDKDVGGKYKDGTFGNKETIKIRGNFEEKGSGLAMIYYQLYTTVPTTTQINSFVADPAGKADGYFAPKPASETTRRVFYNGTISGITADGTAGGKNYITLASTYLTTLSSFKAGHNYLVLVAVDNVGNAAVDNISENYYIINVDTQAPETATITDTYTNGKDADGNDKDLKLALTVTDNPTGTNSVQAGIKSVKVKMNGVAEEKTATLDTTAGSETYGKHVATIPASELPGSGTYSVSVTAVDNAGAGNSDTRVVGSVIVDKTDPSVRITSTPDEWIKNSIGSISVSVNDVNGIKDDKVSYNVYLSTDTSYSSSKANGTATITDGAATVTSITTSNTTNFEDGKSYIVCFTAEDIVGNKTSVNTNPFKVDRTIPTLTDANSGIGIGNTEVKTLANVGNAYFNGETLKVFGAYTDKAGSTVSGGTEITGSGVTEISYSLTPAGATTAITGSWPTTDGTYSSNLAGFKNGNNTLVLSAVDKMGNTSASTTYTVKVDTEAPVISEVNTNDFTAITLTNGTGTRTFEFNVADTGSGMNTTVSTITVKAGTNDIKNGVNGSTISVGALSNGKRKVTVKVGANDLIKLNGNNSVTAKVKDNAGNESNAERIGVLKVDPDKPVPSFTSHQASETVNKTITLGGTITDESNSAIKSIALTVTCGSTTKNYAYPTGTDGNITYANGQWSLSIDTNTAAYNNGTTAKAMSLSLKATDEADNESAAVTLALSIDQNSDRPVVKFTNLVKDDSGNYILKYGNDATLEGTITDDDSTSDKVVTKFYASESAITSDDGWTPVSGKTNTWQHTVTGNKVEQVEFNSTTGDFKYIPANKADGPKTVYFYVEDNTGAKFYTSQTTQLTRPKMQFKTDALNETANAAALSYNSDSNAPGIKTVTLKAYSYTEGEGENEGVYTQTGSLGLGSNCIVGGPSKKYVDINITANDGNGIKGIVVILEQEGKDTIYYRSNTNVSESGVEDDDYTDSTEVDSSTSSADYTYATSRLDVSDYAEAPVNVTIKVYDQSGLYSNQESMFVVDNTAPTLTIENFEDGDVVYGIKKNTVGGTINGATDVEKIYYAVTKDKVNNTAVASNSIAAANWIEVTGQKISAKIIFGGTNADSATGQIDKSLRQYLMDIYGHDEDYMIEHDDNLGLAIHFKAVDACGNTGYSKRTLEVVPNGDKPTITLTYPVDLSANTHPALAGTIRIYGNAEVAEGNVAAVYVQIDTNYNATNGFNADWETGFNSLIAGKGTTYTVEQIGNRTDLKGVKATGTLNWNLPINGNKEFNPTGSSRPMAIRIYGVGGSGKVSEYVEQVFTVDPNAPHIGGDGNVASVMQLKLVQLDDSGNITNQRPYKSGDWVTGHWYVAASVYDDSGIRSITLDQNDGYDKIKIVDGTVKQTAYTRKNQANFEEIRVDDNDCAAAINNVTGKKNFDIYIPLPTTEGSGSVNFTIEAVEAAENANSSTENIKINYDNTPPKLGTVGHESYNANAYNVRQDNGFYRIFGYATDTEAGSVVSDMKAVAFYFVRRGSANTRVYDPMWKNKPIVIQTGTTNETGITYEYGMFWNEKDVDLYTETVNGVTTTDYSKLIIDEKDDNIHAGGLVLIEGTIYTIREVSSDGLTITLKTEVPANITTAKFAYAMVIDNFDMTESTDGRQKETDSTKYGYGYYKADSTADDGDLMQEKWASGKWEAWINSANIPDGPIEIHYVALDNAQNYSVGIVGNLSWDEYHNMTNKTLDVTANGNKSTKDSNNLISGFDYIYDANKKAYVSNNAPRIAGVKVGCDFDGNGSISEAEKTSKYVATETIYSSGGSTTRITGVSSEFDASKDNGPLMTVKDQISIEVEIIGGNGNIYNQYSIDTTKKSHSEITSSWKNYNNLTYYTDEDLTTEITSTITDTDTVYIKEAFKWLDVKDQDDATSTYYIDEALTTNAEDSTDDETVVYAIVSYKWKDTKGRFGNISRAANEGLNGSYYTTTTLPAINFTNDQLVAALGGADANNGPRWFTVELWDSTEETTPYNNSQYAALKLPLDLQVNDKTAPNTVFNDLYWNSSTDNSVYTNPSTDKLEGHVELKGALTGSTFGTTGGYGTDDDKISGKVVFRGYAYDNKRLKSLNWGIRSALKGTNEDQYLATKQAWPQTSADGTVQYVTPVPYNTASGKWGTKSGEGANETWSYSSGNPDVSSAPFYYFKVYDDAEHGAYLNENGHKVYWELTIDTSHVQEPGKVSDDAWAVGKDLYVYVEATDNADRTTNMNPTVVTTGTDAQKIRPNYKVDVVPYITGIKSRLSDNRSSNGRYQLADDETGVELIGYNLKVGSANLGITVPNASGAYSTTIHGCVTINNLNNNDAVGSITDATEAAKVRNKYNYQPSSYNNSLTDDVYIDLWQFNNRAAQTNTGFGFIKEPVMKYNPRNGNLGFAFSNGANKFSMANGTTTSYSLWEFNYASYVGNALAFDERGRSHGISVGQDTEPNSGKAGRMNYFYSTWGVSDTTHSDANFRTDTNANHIDCIGTPNGNDLNSNTPPDNSWANCTIMEQRFKSVSMVATTRGANDAGTINYTATPRVYIAYYDDIREQITFKYGAVGDTTRTTYGQIQSSGDPNGNQQNRNSRAFSVPTNYWSVIADGGSATPYKPGEYLDIAVKPGTSLATDVVCVVWFDATNSKLMYSYKVGPNTDNDASTRTGNYTAGYWSNAVTLKQNCGEYCKIAIDANGGVHITAYDRGNKGVGYVYLPTYNSTYSEANNYYIIDAINGPYDELGIDVAIGGTNNNYAYPTISYYSNGTPKMAIYTAGITKTSGMPEKSWENDSFTGNWDVCFVPTASNLLKDHINVAQPKGQGGVIECVSETSSFATAGTSTDGTVTGNTTTNPILGYAIREGAKGYMEIAQRK